jgi:arylsulfatase A
MNTLKTKSIAIATLFSFGIALQQISCNTIHEKEKNTTPNFVVIFIDDMGYGDIGAFGHPTIKTPNLDKMATEGQKWTNFYVASSVCSPSRAALLTGRLPVRTGVTGVLFADSETGLPQSEISIAKILKDNGYKTAAVGKWHLGHKSPFLPTDHGFDSYYGIPYSNDMNREEGIEGKDWIDSQTILAERENYQAYNVPLMRDDQIVERPVDQRTITKRYTEEAVSKIKSLKDEPFFIYLAHSLPHIPLFRSEEFKDVSTAGFYGDVIEEIDWSVGQVLKTLKEEGLDENTLVVFTSDNGPWHVFKTHGGTAGLLQGAKGGTFEGGFRVPTIFRWPGKIEPGVVMEMGSTMDLMPTLCNLSDSKLPEERVYDGYDISPVLMGTGESPRDELFYYRGKQVYAVRKGEYKAHFITELCWGNSRTSLFVTDPEIEIADEPTVLETPLLYNVNIDPSERFNIADQHPEVIAEIRELLEEHQARINP